MAENDLLTQSFETHRAHLRSVAYRMLGSLAEADDAVQESWLHLGRADTSKVANMRGWLTTVVARVCLDMLRSRKSRREDPFDPYVPDPVVTLESGTDPEHEALLSDSVGLALLVVLESLQPDERLAFVLHDVFAVPFDEIATMIDKTPANARQLATRARRRVQGQATVPDVNIAGQRRVVDAFFQAAREGNFEALVAVLHPDVIALADGGPKRPNATGVTRGAATVAGQALTFAKLSQSAHPVLVNGAAGMLVAPNGRPFAVMGFTVRDGKIVAIDALTDPDRLERLDLPSFDDARDGA
jgi:RNA polymerase sigma factor (sigma-70 family)